MKTISKIITGSIAALALASSIAATPAAAGGYYYRNNSNAGAVAGAAIAGLAIGAMVGVAASQPRGDDDSYDYPPPPAYGYDSQAYGDDGY